MKLLVTYACGLVKTICHADPLAVGYFLQLYAVQSTQKPDKHNHYYHHRYLAFFHDVPGGMACRKGNPTTSRG